MNASSRHGRGRDLLLAAGLLLMSLSGCQWAAHGQNMEGVRLYERGQYLSALQKFQEAMASNPENADAYYNLASTMHRVGNQNGDAEMLSQAEALYNQCLDRNGDHADCYRALAVLLVETGRSDRAFALAKNWAMRSPQSADARVELARLYEEFGDQETARLYLHQATSIDVANSRAWAALGRMSEQTGDYSQALASYQRSYNLNSFQPAVAERIASLSRAVGAPASSPVGDTRMVRSPSSDWRY